MSCDRERYLDWYDYGAKFYKHLKNPPINSLRSLSKSDARSHASKGDLIDLLIFQSYQS